MCDDSSAFPWFKTILDVLFFYQKKPSFREELAMSLGTIDYRCANRRFWLSAHDCQVPTPNLNFSKPRSRTENSDFWSRMTQQLLGRLKSTIPNLQMYSPRKANSEKLGLGITIQAGQFF
jgi:hypothetical protein